MIRSFLPLALLAAALLTGCTKPEPTPGEPGTLSLLQRQPDLIVQSVGSIVPDVIQQWGARTVGGWSNVTQAASSEAPLRVRSLGPEAGLWLDVPEVEDRVLELELGVPGLSGSQRAGVLISLNKVEAQQLELGPGFDTVRVEAPAVLWQAGRNLLQIRLIQPEDTAPGAETDPGAPANFELAGVRYGPEETVELGAQSARMAANTSLQYRLELRGDSRLELDGRVAGEARLLFSVAPFEPGSDRIDPARAREWNIDSEDSAEFSQTIDLSEFESRHLQLDLRLRGSKDASATLSRAALVELQSTPRPPVIVVVIDTLAARHMSLYGYPRPTTPVLEEFAKDCVVFEQAYSNASWTLPSFQAMLTGLYPRAHLLERPDEAGFQPQLWDTRRLVESRTTLAEAFRSAGWSTFAHFDNPFLGEVFGTKQGFDSFSIEAARIDLSDRSGGIDMVRDSFFDWLDDREGESAVFAMLHCLDVHGPYAPAEKWIKRVTSVPTPYELPAEVLAGALTNSFGAVPSSILAEEDPPPTVDPAWLIDKYDGGIAEVDSKLRNLFDGLRSRGLYDEAVIVLTADHGESMLQNDVLFGHSAVFDAVTRIPLMVKLPQARRGGSRVETPVQTVDLMPTLLDLCGMDVSEGRFHGRSLLPMLDGEAMVEVPILQTDGSMEQAALRFQGMKVMAMDTHRGDVAARISVRGLQSEFIAENFPEIAGRGVTSERLAAIDERFGSRGDLNRWLMKHTPRWLVRMYDLDQDPFETTDTSHANLDERARLLGLLSDALVVAEVARVQEIPPTSGGLSDDQIEALQAAGYLED